MTGMIPSDQVAAAPGRACCLSRRADRARRLGSLVGQSILLLITSSSILAVAVHLLLHRPRRHAVLPAEGFREFFTSTDWYPSGDPPAFGALAIFFGSAMVTLGAILVAVPLGVLAALCLSDILPFAIRQMVKPVIEILAAIPSVAYGFFALVVFAPLAARARRPPLGLGRLGSSARRWPRWASWS